MAVMAAARQRPPSSIGWRAKAAGQGEQMSDVSWSARGWRGWPPRCETVPLAGGLYRVVVHRQDGSFERPVEMQAARIQVAHE